VTRVSGDVGPATVSATSRLYSRHYVYQVTLTGPTEPGKHSVSYALQGPNGRIAGPVTVALEVYQGSSDCGELSLGRVGVAKAGERTLQTKVGQSVATTIGLRNCGGMTWRGYRLERVGTGVSMAVPTISPGRTGVMLVLIERPSKAGTTTLTYQLRGPRGPVGKPIEISLTATKT
jgi:hypothetical protein